MGIREHSIFKKILKSHLCISKISKNKQLIYFKSAGRARPKSTWLAACRLTSLLEIASIPITFHMFRAASLAL
jgi:hypothetical protein